MFFAVTWIFYEWIQHHALHKLHDQAMTFQWNLLHGLRAYARLVEWFPLASICDSKPVSHVCYCQNHNNRKSDFSKLCIKSARKVICCCKIVVVNWFIKTASQDSMYLFRGKIYSNICLEICSIKLCQFNIQCVTTKHKLKTWNISLLLNCWRKQAF